MREERAEERESERDRERDIERERVVVIFILTSCSSRWLAVLS